MADNIVKVGVDVSDNGTSAKTTKNVEKLKDVIDQTKASAAAAGKTIGSMSGVAARPSMAQSRAMEAQASQAYGVARGAIGTGAEGRDFAKQSQGLGGLVRLYATFAANLFAAEAAFRALSTAMDTSNMIKGMDQLGARSGIALGSLAKQFAQVSDGAISLREAMEATAKATSSGLSSKQLLQLGEVAKKASQALGINMSDAVSRLTRGISKLEPELLDELGIFTKVGKSSEDYARGIGKSVSALTDFEKRQAFANAVLSEGIQKFSEINIPSNPYDKLLASLKNISFQILEVINKGLTPLISLLSESPKALTAILAGLATLIAKQALPVLSQYKTSLKDAAEGAKSLAEAKAAAAKASLDKARSIAAEEIKLEKDRLAQKKTDIVDQQQRNLQAIAAGQGITKRAQQILRPDRPIQDITAKQLEYIDKQSQKQTALAGTYKALALAIKEAQKAEDDYQATVRKLEEEKLKAPGRFSAAGVAQIRAEAAARKSASLSILSSVGEAAQQQGTRAAFGKLFEGLKTEKLGLLRGAFTGVAGAASILTTAVSGLFTALSSLFSYIGIAVITYQVLSSLLSKNSAETEKFNSSLDNLQEATKTATDVQKKYGETLSVDSIIAKSTALNNLSDSIKQLYLDFEQAKASANWFDNFIDSLLIPLGKDLNSKISKQLALSILASLKGITDPKTKEAAENQIKKLLNIPKDVEFDFSAVENGINKSNDAIKKGLGDVVEAANAAEKKIKEPLEAAKEGFSTLEKSFTELSNTLINKDPLTVFALNLNKQAALLNTAFENTQTQAAQLKDILNDTSKIKMFPPETQAAILEAANNISKLTEDTKIYQEQLELGKKKIAASRELQAGGAVPEVYLRIRMEGEALFGAATQALNTTTKKLEDIKINLTSGLSKAAEGAFKLIEAPLARAIAQASIDSQKTLLGFLPKTAESVQLNAKLESQSIELRKQEISSIDKLISALDKDRLSREKIGLEEKVKTLPEGSQERREAEKQLALVQQQLLAYTDPNKLKGEAGLSPQTLEILARRTGVLTQLTGFTNQQQNAIITGLVNSVSAGFAQVRETEQRALSELKAANAEYFASQEFQQLSSAEQIRERAKRAEQETAKTSEIQQLGPKEKESIANVVQAQATRLKLPEVASLAERSAEAARNELESLKGIEQSAANVAGIETTRAATFAEVTNLVERQKQASETAYKIATLENQAALDSLAYDQQKLDYLNSIGLLSQDEYTNQKRLNDLKQADLELSGKLLSIQADYLSKQRELGLLMADPKNAGNLPALADQARANAQAFAAETDAARKSADLKIAGINLTKDANERTQRYADFFKQSVASMGDAIVDFALTGKQSFGDMIKSMIAQLIKLEYQMQITKAFSALGGFEGIAGSFLSAIGLGSSAGAPPVYGPITGSNAVQYTALGAAYDGGIQAFAKGGAFTNTIVTKPTMFAFAKGAGLMGEAGPEAIMPLKRGPNGSLGVQAGQPAKVDVVVNNYSQAQATTRETQDARGNRKIEVIIGEMAAAELQRPNSPMQNTMRGTFGVTPMLTRR